MFRTLSLLAGMALLGSASAAEPPEVSLDALQLAPWVYALRPNVAIGNPSIVAIIDQGEALLIDAGIPDNGPVLRDWLRERGVTRVRYIATTHYHTDHVWGLENFAGDRPVVLATAEQATRLAVGGTATKGQALDTRVQPQLLVEDRLQLRFGGQQITLMRPPHRASHTDGDLLAWIQPANVLVIGDHYIADRFPVIDLGGGGSLWGYLANLDWLQQLANPQTQWIPGHGHFEPTPWRSYRGEELAHWTQRLRDSVAVVAAARLDGLDLPALQERGLGEAFADLHQRPRFVKESAWIASVHAALEQCEARLGEPVQDAALCELATASRP